MRISNLKAAGSELKKGIKYIICCGLVGTILSMPVSSLAERNKSNMRFQFKNVQTTDWDMEANYFPTGRVLYTSDYMEQSYLNYLNSDALDEIEQDDLIVVHETECMRMEKDDFYFKTRYRIWFHDIKVTDFEDMETIARVERDLNNLFSGLKVDDAIDIISVEDIVIKSNESLDPNDACSKRWIESISVMDYEEESDLPKEEEPISNLPKEEPTSKQNIILNGAFILPSILGIVALGRDLASGHDSNTKGGIKRYFKRRKKQTNFTQKMSKS